jgi:hypothetical protein
MISYDDEFDGVYDLMNKIPLCCYLIRIVTPI